MTYTPAEVIATYLANQGLGTLGSLPSVPNPNQSWQIFATYFPPDGDQAFCVLDTTAMEDGRLMRGQPISHPGLQIIVRAPTAPVSYDMAIQIHSKLKAILNQVVTLTDGSTYHVRNAASIKLPMKIGQEIGKNRYLFSLNFLCTIDEYNQL